MTLSDDKTIRENTQHNSRSPFIGLKCKITIRKGEHTLFFTGKIIAVDNIGITFYDKFNNLINTAHSELVSLEEIKENKWFGNEGEQ